MHLITIKSFHTLTQAQTLALKDLLRECINYDKNMPNIQWFSTQANGINSVFLYQKDNDLLGCLKLFFFDDDSVEIALIVKPSSRRQGIATRLYESALELLKQNKVKNLKFRSTKTSNPWLESIGATIFNTELILQHKLQNLPPCPKTSNLAEIENTQDLIELDVLCFEERSLTPNRIHSLLQQDNYHLWVTVVNGKAIAKLHIKFTEETAYIYDVAVHPDNQRQGHAKDILLTALHCALEAEKQIVELEVDRTNIAALRLYTNAGFTCQHTNHHWQLTKI